jgi:zinc protease
LRLLPIARAALFMLTTGLYLATPSGALGAWAPRAQTLENGLKVVLLEDHSTPQVAATVWIHVGGKDESEPVAGFAHYMEHLIPQGTKGRSPRQQQLEIFQAGGTAMIQSDYDRTFFFALAPKEFQDRALEGLFQLVAQPELSTGGVAKIRPLLTGELKQAYDDPGNVLFLEQMRAAFPGQPYRFPYYGNFDTLAKLEKITAEAFHSNFYVANNMVVAVGGDIQPSRTLAKIRELFGGLKPSKTLPPKPKFEEGFQGGRTIVKNLGDLPVSVSIVFPTPGYRHPDRMALEVLGRLLEGPGTALLVKEAGGAMKAAGSASGGFHLLESRGLLALTSYPGPAASATDAGGSILGALEKIRGQGISEAEIRKAIKALRLEVAVRRNSLGSLTQELAEAALYGDLRYGWDLERSLERITPEDVRRVASTYLVGDAASTLIILPKEEKKPGQEALNELAQRVAALGPGKGKAVAPSYVATVYGSDRSSPASRPERRASSPASRSQLANGMTVVIKPERGRGLVGISLQVRAGFAFDPPGKEGLAQMVAAFLPQGGPQLPADAIQERVAALGSSFGLTTSVETAEAGLTVFPDDLAAALDLLAAVMRSPSFPESQLSLVRDRIERHGARLDISPAETAREVARQKIYRDHPYSRSSAGGHISLAAIRREDFETFYRSTYRPERAVLTLVGDFDPAAARTRIEASLGAWTAAEEGKGPELPDLGSDPISGEFTRVVDASPSQVILAFPGLPLKDPQFPVLRVLGTVMSARGFVDLVLNQPLALSVHAGLEGLSRGGLVMIEASTPPEEASRVAYELMLRARALALRDVSVQALQDVRAVERGRLLREKESVYTEASNLGFYELIGPGFAAYEEGKTIPDDLSPAALREAAAVYLDSAKLVRVTAGPMTP